MSEAIRHLSILYSNPFIFSPVLFSFYNEIKNIDRNILLSYLILPLSLYPESKKYLIGKKHPRSSLRILAKEHRRLYGLQERIKEYKDLTNSTLQYCINIGVLSINSNQSIQIEGRLPERIISPPDSCKAARRLAEFMSNFDVATSYRMLGVKQL